MYQDKRIERKGIALKILLDIQLPTSNMVSANVVIYKL